MLSRTNIISVGTGATIVWGIYSIFIGVYIMLYDTQVSFWRRKVYDSILGWVHATISLDGPYFSYYYFMCVSVGPGIGLMFAWCGKDPDYYNAVMKSMFLQGERDEMCAGKEF